MGRKILFVTTDQQRYDALGCNGNEIARTPVVDKLAAMASVIFVARTLGRFDILVTVRAFSAAQLVELLDIVRAMPGVNAVESWAHLEVVKESYASGLDVPAAPR